MVSFVQEQCKSAYSSLSKIYSLNQPSFLNILRNLYGPCYSFKTKQTLALQQLFFLAIRYQPLESKNSFKTEHLHNYGFSRISPFTISRLTQEEVIQMLETQILQSRNPALLPESILNKKRLQYPKTTPDHSGFHQNISPSHPETSQ